MFVVSTYFGSFSLYGAAVGDINFYKMTPCEQFYARDYDLTVLDEETL